MPELVIKYKNKKTLDALKDLAKYFEFSIISSTKSEHKKPNNINGLTIIPADSSIDTSELKNLFSNRNIDSKKLRSDSWQRNK
jgi:hypothetical protein